MLNIVMRADRKSGSTRPGGISQKLCKALKISGPFNIQFICKDNEVKVIAPSPPSEHRPLHADATACVLD